MINILGHKFIKYKYKCEYNSYYECMICKIVIFINDEICYISKFWDPNCYNQCLNLTCNEIIIKNILE